MPKHHLLNSGSRSVFAPCHRLVSGDWQQEHLS